MRDAIGTRHRPSRLDWCVSLALALLVPLIGAPRLDDYSVTWDEALGDLFYGQRYLSFFLSGDREFLDPEASPYPSDSTPDLSSSPFKDRPWEYYPFANMLAAASSRVLSGSLGWLDPFDGFHALNLWLVALLVLVLWRFVAAFWDRVTATLACGFLLSMPRVICHLMANVKDTPEMCFFALTLIAFVFAYERGSARGIMATGLLWGLALATKANALFLPAIVGPVVLASRPAPWQGQARRLWMALGVAGILGPTVMCVLWPYLWPSPIVRFWKHLDYVGGQVFQVRPESLLSAPAALLWTTPPLMLLAFVLGLLPLLRGVRQRRLPVLTVALWILVVVGRMLLPGAVNFDGVRHFLELFPAFALVAAWGVSSVLRKLLGPSLDAGAMAQAVRWGVVTLVLMPGFWVVWRTHPHQIAYFNSLVGGLKGAQERGIPQAGDYWGMSYRQGLRWINEEVPEGSVLAVPIGGHIVELTAPLWLRADIGLAAVSVPNFPDIPGDRVTRLAALAETVPVYVMYVLREDWANQLTRDCESRLVPEREWQVEGAPILRVYRYRQVD